MFTQFKDTISRAQDRRRIQHAHRRKTLEIDALALTELGYPPADTRRKERGWFYYL